MKLYKAENTILIEPVDRRVVCKADGHKYYFRSLEGSQGLLLVVNMCKERVGICPKFSATCFDLEGEGAVDFLSCIRALISAGAEILECGEYQAVSPLSWSSFI
jgi:hypothetical protein